MDYDLRPVASRPGVGRFQVYALWSTWEPPFSHERFLGTLRRDAYAIRCEAWSYASGERRQFLSTDQACAWLSQETAPPSEPGSERGAAAARAPHPIPEGA